MAPKFGTSGLRGLAVDLTDAVCTTYVRAFLDILGAVPGLMIGRDLRASSPAIAAAVARAAVAAGLEVVDQGCLPTPALALASMGRGWPAVMITGSHIPADRNGLKFYTAAGEITKAQELAILAALAQPSATGGRSGRLRHSDEATEAYLARYAAFFGPDALAGQRIGVFEHSTVGRDLLARVVGMLGGTVLTFGRSDLFVSLDTEAVPTDIQALLRTKAAELSLDAVVSADGDADRPLLTDADGVIVPGDILGTLTARALGADGVAVPVSANSLIEQSRSFACVRRTRIGSPFVIEAMQALSGTSARPVGFEPNGGFLLGFAAERAGHRLAPLPTRDALLPILAVLTAARGAGGVQALLEGLPSRRTASDRLQDIPVERSADLIAQLTDDPAARAGFLADFGQETALDQTDGLRLTFADGLILHLRPSGNAPEFRIYIEAETAARATIVLTDLMGRIAARLASA